MHGSEMTSLTSLPVELVSQTALTLDDASPANSCNSCQISRIADFTDPFSHLDLTCTCRYTNDALEDLFKHHRAAYAQPPCSDVDPSTIPQTLRSVIADPFAAYHFAHDSVSLDDRRIPQITSMLMEFRPVSGVRGRNGHIGSLFDWPNHSIPPETCSRRRRHS